MSLFTFLKSLFYGEPEREFGIIRGDELTVSDNVHEQNEAVAMVAKANFPVKKINELRKFPYQYQYSSKSCVAFTTAKISTILYWLLNDRVVRWSPGFWYTQRVNKPEGGMGIMDIMNLASKGAITNELLPSEGLTEIMMNNLEVKDYLANTADGFAISQNWINLPLDFDTVASTIEITKKPIMLWFAFGSGEFFYTSYPKTNSILKPWNHSVTAVDTVTLNNKQYIVIEDSADYEQNYQKFIDRDFFKRCFLARYPLNFKYAIAPNSKPTFDGSIVSLQDCLKHEGLFPANTDSTGIFGSITKNALILFQKKYGIEPSVGILGDKTKAKLSELYK